MHTQMGNITLSNLREFTFSNYTKQYKCYTALAKIEGLEGVHEVLANELVTTGCDRLIEGVTLNTWLVFNSLKTSNTIEIKEVM